MVGVLVTTSGMFNGFDYGLQPVVATVEGVDERASGAMSWAWRKWAMAEMERRVLRKEAEEEGSQWKKERREGGARERKGWRRGGR